MDTVINFANEKIEKEDTSPLLSNLNQQDIQNLEKLILENDSLYEMHDQVGV